MAQRTRDLWKGGPLMVLLDMDGVMGDFDGYFLKCFREKYPDEPFVPVESRRHFYLSDDYKTLEGDSPEILHKTRSVFEAKGFFQSIPPIPGALEAAKEISGIDNVEVFLCTSPLTKTFGVHFDVMEKHLWVEEHLGLDWTKRLIITRDKTMVHGNILIDDKPRITGSVKPPNWDHILFTCSHNKHLSLGRTTAVSRLENWTNGTWREIINEYLKRLA